MADNSSSYGLLGPDPDTNMYGGLLGGKIDPLLLNMALGVFAAGRPGGNIGVDLGSALNNYSQQRQASTQNALGRQQLGMNALNMQWAQQTMPLKLGWLKAAGERLHQANNDPQLTQQLQAQTPSLWDASNQGQQAPQPPSLMTVPSSVPTIPGAPTGFGSAPPIQAAPMQVPTRQTAPPQSAQVGQRPQDAVGNALNDMDFASYGAMLGMPGTNEMIERAKAGLQYSPEVATQMEAAKSAVTVDQQQMKEAAARGDYALAAQLQQKIAKDTGTLDVQRGTRSWFDTNTGTWRSIDTSTGMTTNGTDVSLAPGAAQATQQRAAAQALGQARGELVPVIDPNTHQTYMVPKSTLLGGGAASSGAPAQPGSGTGTPSSTPGIGGRPITALSPGQSGYLAERGTESAKYVMQLQEAADSATNTNYSLDQMLAAGQRVRLGPAAGVRQWTETAIAGLGQPFGIEPPKELSNYQELGKYANQVAFAATRQMGSREAAQIVGMQIESNPNKSLAPDAFFGLIGGMKAMNNYMIAKNTAIQAQSGGDNDSALQAASAWTQKIDPRVWALSISPELAGRFATSVGTAKIATAIPAMASDDAISVIRNIPEAMRPQVLARLPAQVKQEILSGMSQTGATGYY